jgi:hypothetical protein
MVYIKQQKNSLQSTINMLDIAAETRVLIHDERDQLYKARDDLSKLLREKDIKYYERAKPIDILFGDSKTRYFQKFANGKHRKKRIFPLDHENEKIEGQVNLKAYITHFYKELFGEPEYYSFTLDDARIDDIPQVTPAEN